MDRNSITGIILITLILAFFWWMNKPTEEQLREMKKQQDSLAKVELAKTQAKQKAASTDSVNITAAVKKDSVKEEVIITQKFGLFAEAATGKNELITLENKELKVTFASKGGRIYSVELKNYLTHDKKPLILFSGDNNRFGFTFTYHNRVFNTNDLYFIPKRAGNDKIDFIVNAGNEGSLTFSYELPAQGFMVNFDIQSKNLQNIITAQRGGLELEWKQTVPAQEKSPSFERRYGGVYFKYYQDEVDHVNAKNTDEDIVTKIKWIAYKDQFFSTAFISNKYFLNGAVKVEVPENREDRTILTATSFLSIPYEGNGTSSFSFYFGPNDFKVLKAYKDIDLQKLVYLGWGFLRYINLGVIEVFHFLEGFINNYGLIILILTLLIKLLLFPLTYKSYISTAKMRVLKPQVDAIYEKIPKDKAMERQQAVMALYRKAGVNQLGGCLPMLLQMPILFAMFQFFPASIELRQQSFLWAHDLSSYDSILTLPFTIPFYGNHVSLFTLLMTITNVVYTYINQQMTQSSQQMPGMKGMMYMMPVMFLFFFNNYAAGLSYYYFISTLITIGQTLLIRRFVDEEALLAKLEENKKKPKKKSKFQQRLEEMQKQQQKQIKKRK